MSSSRKYVIGGIAGVILLSLTGIGLATQRDSGPAVRTETVERRDLVATVTATGYVQPKRRIDISADISGRVTELFVEEGQWVESGELILRIDPTSYEANVRRATASAAQARAQAAQTRASFIRAEGELDRAERLAGAENLISPADLEQARTELMVAEAQLEAAEFGVEQAEAGVSEAREQLRKTTISAPMSGYVTRLNIEAGETAVVGTMNNPGSLLLTIADLSTMEALVRVGETDIPRMAIGDSAQVRIDAYPDQVFPGVVTRIANSAVNAPGDRSQAPASAQQSVAVDFEVVVTLADPPAELRPDLTATAEVVTARRIDVIAVPIVAVTVRDEEGNRLNSAEGDAEAAGPAAEGVEVEGVFVLQGSEAVWTPVQLGIVGSWYFEVLTGLEAGETVIAGPYAAVRDLEAGTAVEVTADGSPATADS
ncbi:MAG: efflux RND transporter periplasmic adaptor subunit [Gemmatimonadota bacterium]